MSLYTRRSSSLEVFAENLFDQNGQPVESIQTPELTVKLGDKTLTLKLIRGSTTLGELSTPARVKLTLSEKTGFSKEKPVLKLEL